MAFEQTIYGEADPVHGCYRTTAQPTFLQLAPAQPGELVDRYRNEHRPAGMGYPMTSLHLLYTSSHGLFFHAPPPTLWPVEYLERDYEWDDARAAWLRRGE